MKRREFISVLGGADVSPVLGLAQQPERRVGVLMAWPEKDAVALASAQAFSQALARF